MERQILKSQHDLLVEMTEKYAWLSHVQYGVGNAIALRDLCGISGIKNRELRLQIESVRREGLAICTDGGGYFFPENFNQYKKWADLEGRRARSILKTVAASYRHFSHFVDLKGVKILWRG
ncbi:MAG: hypothetical protein Q8876_03705 [Bacillota bacterium]|nr:hypothetical protein [Bacillota bacterium]